MWIARVRRFGELVQFRRMELVDRAAQLAGKRMPGQRRFRRFVMLGEGRPGGRAVELGIAVRGHDKGQFAFFGVGTAAARPSGTSPTHFLPSHLITGFAGLSGWPFRSTEARL